MKTFICPTGVEHPDDDLLLATDLCREAKAHLSVLVLGLAAPPPTGDYAGVASNAWLEARHSDMERLKARTDEVTQLLSAQAVSTDVISEFQEAALVDQAVGRRARYGDLTIIGPRLLGSDVFKLRVLEGALFASARPLLLVPQDSRPTLKPKRVLAAWDSRMESSAAVKDSLDMLKGAEDVRLVLVDPVEGTEAQGAEPGADAATYLARHGVKVTVDRIPSLGRAVVDALKCHATDCAAELLVMGAYGHSRLRERIFGGVTRSMIEEPTLPTFMSR